MKWIGTVFSVGLMLCGQPVAGQTVGKNIVPIVVEQKFLLENPDVKAIWSKDGDLYRAAFINPVNNLGYVLVYNKDGRVVKREKELEHNEYPAPIVAFHDKYYPGEGLAIYSSIDSLGNLLFYSRKNNKVFWFDTSGRLLTSLGDSIVSPSKR